MKISKKQNHTPVLLTEVISYLNVKPGNAYLDLTAGYAGHSEKIIEQIGNEGSATLVDQDEYAVDFLKKKFKNVSNVEIIHNDFLSASKKLLADGRKYDVILADLGVSSVHLDNPERGFSFKANGPLDMRMDQRRSVSANDVVNSYDEQQLYETLRKYGELRDARKIAKLIVQNRPINDTKGLADLIARNRRKRGKTHPATEIFQAIRIEVNEELKQLEKSLPIWLELLCAKGRLGVISFHSLEDRIVKNFFRDNGDTWYDAKLQIVTKQPVIGSDEEVVFNPRARSAKLRVAQRK